MKERLLLTNSINLALVLAIPFLAFSMETKRKIKDRAKGVSELSGASYHLQAAHWNHDKSRPEYDTPENGRLLTIQEHYLDHFYRRDNGLSDEANHWAVWALWEEMENWERRKLPKPETYYDPKQMKMFDEAV